jgi:hypothetical protein
VADIAIGDIGIEFVEGKFRITVVVSGRKISVVMDRQTLLNIVIVIKEVI